MLLEGMQLGRYRLVNLLGTGGMGEVYLGEDTHIRRQVAIKVTRAEATPYPNSQTASEAKRLFQREVRAIASLDHPYILPLYDYGEQDLESVMLTYMVMPYRREGSLTTWLRQRGEEQALAPGEVAHFIQQAALALAYAHKHQIVHQDVKPSNFLLRDNELSPDLPDLLLADFGVAKFTSASASMSQSSRGTPTYMAPEQWSGQPVPASDQYALAVMTYQLLTGSLPFQGRQEQVMYQHFHVEPQRPGARNPWISNNVDTVILRALSKNPDQRYPTITAFSDALKQAIAVPEPAKAAPSTTSGALPKPTNPLPYSEGDIRATIAISRQEAATGSTRNLNLPGGRRITVPIPSGIPNGQVIRLENQGETTGVGTTGALVLTIAVAPDETRLVSHSGNEHETVRSDPQVAKRQMIEKQPAQARKLRLVPRGRVAMIVGVVVLIVLLSSGVFYFKYFNFIHRWSLLSAGIANPYNFGMQRVALNDPLSDNSLGNFWPEVVNATSSSCQFSNGAYQAIASSQVGFFSCTAENNYSKFTYEVQMKMLQGTNAGIVFRADSTNIKLYSFQIAVDGSYSLNAIESSSSTTSLKTGHSTAINAGLNQSNLIAVVAVGSTLSLYINGKQIDSATDSAFSQGSIGVIASNSTEVVFSNARVWTA